MSLLDRKLVREILQMRSQMAAIALVAACGIALFVAMRTMYGYLLETRDAYYERYRFADVFVGLKRAPESVMEEIAAIPGVAAAETRLVFDVLLDVPGLPEPATGRLVSIPADGPPALNALHLRRGRNPEAGRREEVLVSEAFALANDLAPGDTLGAILNGRWQRLRVTGVALSPEYVYEIRGSGEVFPDNRRFGVIWIPRPAVAAAFDMTGAFNDLSLSLAEGASEGEVLERVDLALDRYGGLGAFGREDQISHRFLSDEIAEVRVTSVLIPTIFLAVTAFLLHVVLSRLVAIQREELGVLKAFGFPNAAIVGHVMKLAAAPILAGAAVGTGLGLWFASWLAGLYARYFHFPVLQYEVRPEVLAAAVAVAAGAALAGAGTAARAVAALPAAEAMRPPSPARYRRGVIERLGLQRRIPVAVRTIVRSVERFPVKAALSVLGIALALAIVVVGWYLFDAIEVMKRHQFETIQREDATVVFVDPLASRARHTLAGLPGVVRVEPYRTVAARLRSGHRVQRTAIVGLTRGAELRRIVGADGIAKPPPPGGVLLSAKLGEILRVGARDTVSVEVLEGSRPVRRVPVVGLVDELIGTSAYMEMHALNRLLGEGEVISGAFLAVDGRAADSLYTRLKQSPAVSGVAVREAALAGFEETVAESFRLSVTVIVVFACVIAFGIVYNGTRVALSERGRELASLRVLGFTRSEVAGILFGEQALLTALAVPVGSAIGFALSALIAWRFDTELFRMPLVVTWRTYGLAVAITAGAAFVSALAVRRRIDRLDLVEVLKTRE